MAKALSDDQVANELKKMTMFIRQEALEKAREIEIKADEEFAIEKSKLFRQEIASIDANFEKQTKQASMSQQITKSTLANKTRLKVLSARQELLDAVFEDAKSQLKTIPEDTANYERLCTDLILEGLYALSETRVSLRIRPKDREIVTKAAATARKTFKNEIAKELELSVQEEESLSSQLAGGVQIIGGNGKIDINNTLDERLSLLQDDALPVLRNRLFGKNDNRKFYD